MEKDDEKTTLTLTRKTKNLLSKVKNGCFLKTFDDVLILLYNTSTAVQELNQMEKLTL